MEKVGEDEEKTVGEARSSVEETKSDMEDERIKGTIAERVGTVDDTEEGSTDPSSSHTVTFEDHDVSTEYDMDDEEVLELFRRNNGVRPKVAESNEYSYLNKPEEMVLKFQEDTPAEMEQTSMNDSSKVADLGTVNSNSSVILEGVRSLSASKEDTDDSSSDSDIDSSLSRYYFDGSLPVSDNVEEPETHEDESPVPKDQNQMPLLCPKQSVQQPTSWRNCCGLFELLRDADP